VFLGFIISGCIALLTALVYGEFASMIPKSGSAYVYTYSTLGELPAWIVGWNQNLRYGGTTATQSRGWSSYMMQLFLALGIGLPAQLDSYTILGFNCSPLSVLFLIGLVLLANSGSKSSGDFSNVITIGKLAILGFIVVTSCFYFRVENITPLLNEQKGFLGVIEAATVLFFGYLGFDFITTIAEEAINPKRDIPIAIIVSVVFSMIIYAMVSFAVSGVGVMSASSGDGETALAEIFRDR